MSASPFSEQERQDLVAYLDGELKGEAARALEAKLALDPRARAEADALRRTWELLDFLPRAEPSPAFTQRTLQRVGPAATGAAPARRRWRPWALAAGWAAAVAAALAAGYAGGRAARAREPGDRELVRDLRVIENKRLYELGDDVDFLRALDRPELFGDDAPGS
jgi:anti-sigma factor RsiW